MNAWRRFVPVLAASGAGAVGWLLAALPLPWLGSGRLVFGGLAVLPVAWVCGAPWGLLAALIAYSGTLAAWGHPGALVFFGAEAFVVGWLVNSRRAGPVAASLWFWAAATPLALLALRLFGAPPPFPEGMIAVAALPTSGLLAMLLAVNVLAWLPAGAMRRPWGGDPFRGPLAGALFRRFAALVAVPLAVVALAAGYAFERQVRRSASESIEVSAHDLAGRLDAFLREHERAVSGLADLVLAPGVELGQAAGWDGALFQMRRRYPAFVATLVADAQGRIVAASPGVDGDGRSIARTGRSIADREYFQAVVRTRRPFVSGVFRGGAGGELNVAVCAPVVRSGRVVAVVEGAIDFARFGDAVGGLSAVRDRNVVLVDAAGFVVFALGARAPDRLSNFGPHSLRAAAGTAETPVFFHDAPGETGGGERMLAASAEAGLSGWRVYLEEPWWRSLRVVAGFHGGTLLACVGALLATSLLARRTARAITAPLEALAAGTGELAAGRAVEAALPEDAPSEIARLARDVGQAARQMSEANRRLTQTVEDRDGLNAKLTALLREMDETVRARTADLAAKNEELQDLFEAQREAQLELAESDHRYRIVLESLTQVVFQTDAEGQWTFLSPAWKRLTGHAVEASLYRPALSFFHPDDHDTLRARFARGGATAGDDSNLRVRCRHRDGAYRWLEATARPTVRRPGVAGTLTDVTELIEREEALRLSRERFELAVRGSGAGLWDWEIGAPNIYFSPRAAEILGYRGEELPNTLRTWRGLVHRADRRRTWEALRRHLLGRTPAFEEELRLRRKDGTWAWILSRGAVSRDARGRPRRMAGSCTDISALKGAEVDLQRRSDELSAANAQLARAARLKDEFLASMSHELRTPLNAVLGMSEVLLEEIPGPVNPAQRECVQAISAGGRHLLDLINDVLDLSKIEAGKLTLDCGPVVVAEIVRASLRLVREAAAKKRIRLREPAGPFPGPLHADARRLKQVLLNLLSNAVKFTPEGGEVGLEVSAAADGSTIEFAVCDSGIGIGEAEQARLFRPFVQVDSKLTRNFGGTGLGLAIVRRLAELHGGGVGLRSTAGRGSRFFVVLPTAPATPPPAAPVEWLAPPDAAPRRVLVVEGNEALVPATVALLEARHATVRVARSSDEALELAHAFAPELVVLDLLLPGFEGVDLLRLLRGDGRASAAPIIAVSAVDLPGDRERALGAGAAAFLTKPVAAATLLGALRASAPPAPGPVLAPEVSAS